METWRANNGEMPVSRHVFRIAHAISTLTLPAPPLWADQAFLRAAPDSNVNQRYTIESVSVGGVQVERAKLPSSLRRRLVSMVGARCDMAAIGDMASELRKELHLRSVNEHLSRGSQPDQIRVNFEVVKRDVA